MLRASGAAGRVLRQAAAGGKGEARRERTRAVLAARETPFGWFDWKEFLTGFAVTGGVLVGLTTGVPMMDMVYYKWKPQTWEESARMPEFQGHLLHWPYPEDSKALEKYVQETSETGQYFADAMEAGRKVKEEGGLNTAEKAQVAHMASEMLAGTARELVAAGVSSTTIAMLMMDVDPSKRQDLELEEEDEDV